MPMQTPLLDRVQRHFAHTLHTSLDALLQPFGGANPAGYSVKSNNVYQTIRSARREDDANLPLGPWERKLKRADWSVVSRTASEALLTKTKDLQVAAWLLEAQVHQCGFAGVAPGLLLIDGMLTAYWENLFPQDLDDGAEHRSNILRSLCKSMVLALQQIPLTDAGLQRECDLFAWEQALRMEHAGMGGPTAAAPPAPAEDETHASRAQWAAAMAQTASSWYQNLHATLQDALAALAQLDHNIDQLFGNNAPNLTPLADVLAHINALVEGELGRRGLAPQPAVELPSDEPDGDDGNVPQHHTYGTDERPLQRPMDRHQAYAMLAQLAQVLLQVDPHSPVPYLVQRAVTWGHLNTAELYQEVFIRLGGQLDIFELLGLQSPPAVGAQGA